MCKQVVKLEDYKKEREEKLAESQEYFNGIDLSYENYTNIMEKLKETKDSGIIKEIPINHLDIQKFSRQIEKKYKK